jgi:protein required for attachment to host cells
MELRSQRRVGPELHEATSLVNPDGELTGREVFSDRSGSRRASTGPGSGFSDDDHNQRHREMSHRRFARDIGVAASRFLRESGVRRLLVVASPKFLGLLRPRIHKAVPEVDFVELKENLSSRSIPRIENELERHALLPPRGVPTTIYRPRGQLPSVRPRRRRAAAVAV